jgi:hypothetical protein
MLQNKGTKTVSELKNYFSSNNEVPQKIELLRIQCAG